MRRRADERRGRALVLARRGSLPSIAALGALAAASTAGLGPVAGVGAQASLSRLVDVAVSGSLPLGALALRRLGSLPPAQGLQVGLALRPRDAAGLARYAEAVSTPGSAQFHRYLSPAELAARFGPSAASVAAAVRLLRADGLHVAPVPADRLLVSASGSAARVESAFGVRLSSDRLASGALGWSASGVAQLPASVGDSVAAVVGLNQLAQAQALGVPTGTAPPGAGAPQAAATARTPPPGAGAPQAAAATGGRRSAGVELQHADASSGDSVQATLDGATGSTAAGLPAPCEAALQTAIGSDGWTDDALANAYGFSPLLTSGDLGQGETIAIYELEPYRSSDIAAFDRCYYGHAKPSQVRAVRVDGFDLRGPGVGESVLDIEDIAALVPDAHILVYEAPNTEFGQIDEYNDIVSEDRANIVTTSWAECETALEVGAPGSLQVENTLFEEAAAEGQTFVAASGDTGSDSCAATQFTSSTAASPYLSVDDPASQPYVVGVGGVSLQSATSPPIESAWNDGAASGGGGGGLSNTWPSPPWQESSGVPGTGLAEREVPDVSASADEFHGTPIYASSGSNGQGGPGEWTIIGGTSASTPQWAAALALVADSPGCAALARTAGGPDLGFAAPELYAVASDASSYAASFTDVTSGSNDVFHLGRGYTAGPGYNLVAGLGTPVLAGTAGQPGLAADLCAVATGQQPSGPTVPVITGVQPASGPLDGGGSVTITGSGFPASGTLPRVAFGAATATVQSTSATAIVVTVPRPRVPARTRSFAGATTVDVSVTVPPASAGAEAVSSLPTVAARYQYLDISPSGGALPTVTGLDPQGGVPAGGTRVTIYGSGFRADHGVSSVSFGGRPASFRVVSDAEIVATAPARTEATGCDRRAGANPSSLCQVQVVVSDAAGPSATSAIEPALSGRIVYEPDGIVRSKPGFEIAQSSTEYDYAALPVISSVSPDPAEASATSPVTIRGANFSVLTVEWVDFGPVSSTASQQLKFTYISAHEIKILPPPAPQVPGSTPEPLAGGVTVQTLSGASNTVAFSYQASAPSPSS